MEKQSDRYWSAPYYCTYFESSYYYAIVENVPAWVAYVIKLRY